MTLAEALSQVELEPGRTYECHVQGKRVVVQVAPGSITQPAARYDESDVMLDPWCDLPSPGKGVEVPVFPGQVTTPTIPPIPADDQ